MDYTEQADWLKAAAHPVRLQILNMLRQGEICVCHIENALGKRQAYVSQQLMVLREAGLVHSRKEGLQVFYRLADARAYDLLALTCGPADSGGHHVLDHCPCPACTTAVTTSITFQ
jgi:ArsR family transcriptional regulator